MKNLLDMETTHSGLHRVFKDKICVNEAEALRWVLSMEDSSWTCSRISRLCEDLVVALVWRWVE